MKTKYNVAIVGATGLVGRTVLKVLEEKNLKNFNYTLFASSKSANSKIQFFNETYRVCEHPEELKNHNGIIANPNCSTIQAVLPLKVLDDNYGIKRIVYSTYQAVSGAGKKGIEDLENKYKGENLKCFPYSTKKVRPSWQPTYFLPILSF